VKCLFLICVAGIAAVPTVSAQTRTLRIVTYNIEADIGVTNKQPTFTNIVTSAAEGPPLPGLISPPTNPTNVQAGGVLEGIGEEIVGNDPAQAIDILALEEATSNLQTISPVVNGLNAFYNSPGLFTNSNYQATEAFGGDPTVGNGPNAIVFNTHILQLLASVPVDPPGGTNNLGSTYGEYREVMRYEFAPAGVATNGSNTFYIYVSHYKSGSSSSYSVTNSRAGEAAIIRSSMLSLAAGSQILYLGDFNTGLASEPMYGILTASGTNQLIDPLNPSRNLATNFDGSAAPINLTDSATYLEYRDDYHMMTTNIYCGTGGGLSYVAGTFHAFGNNGTIPYLGTANSGSNTALNNDLATNGPAFINAAQLYVDLTGASDHLPVVADYTIPLPAPVITSLNLVETNLVLNIANSITGGVCTVWTTTNLALPLTNWMALVTNVSAGGSFTLTVTNAVNPAAPGQFYLLQEE
jgi:hypothetical protein